MSVRRLKNLRYIVYILHTVAIIQSIGLVILTIRWSAVRKNISEQVPKETELSYRHRTLNPPHKPPDGCESVFDEVRNMTLVRGPGIEIIKAIVSEATNNLYNDEARPEQPSMHESLLDVKCSKVTGDKPVLKLVDINVTKPNFDGETCRVFWKSVNQAYSHSGLTYSENKDSIQFQKPGLYFVMSQIQFHLTGARATSSSINIKHRVHHISHITDAERIILEHESTPCETIMSPFEKTISVGAIFKFDARDQLYVSTSFPDDLVTNGSKNHLTIFVL